MSSFSVYLHTACPEEISGDLTDEYTCPTESFRREFFCYAEIQDFDLSK